MSTILDALRKAKEAPEPEKPVDARQEILSQSSHNYLAQAPGDDSGNQVPLLLGFITLCVFVISALVILVLWLMLGQDNQQIAESTTAESTVTEIALEPIAVREVLSAPVAQIKSAAAIILPGRDLIEVDVAEPTKPATESATVVPAVSQPAASVQQKAPTAPSVPTNAYPATHPALSDSEEMYRATINKLNRLKIAGILWDEKSPMAMIDGKPCKVGSHIGAAIIKTINSDSVVFEIDGQEFMLRQ